MNTPNGLGIFCRGFGAGEYNGLLYAGHDVGGFDVYDLVMFK